MAFDSINVGASPDVGGGDNLRAGGQKINANFAKISSAADGEGASLVGVEDDNNFFASNNVEGVLAELKGMIPTGALASLSTVGTANLTNNAVTYAKIQALSQACLLGASAAGAVGEIVIGSGLALAGGILSATGGGGAGVTDGDKGDVVVSGGGAVWTVEASNLGASIIANTKPSAAADDYMLMADPDNASDALKEYGLTVSNFISKNIAGKTMLPVMAHAFTPNTTNGPAEGTSETATNKIMLSTLDFDQATQESAIFLLPMPKSWDEGNLTARFRWTAGATGDVIWGVQIVALGDDDAVDAAFGAAQEVTDAVTAAGDLMITAETATIVPGGSPAVNDLLAIKVYRKAADGGDTVAADASLIAVDLFITTNAANDA